jgi:hypothetical protein
MNKIGHLQSWTEVEAAMARDYAAVRREHLRDLFDDLGQEQPGDREEEKIRAAVVLLHDCKRGKRMPLQEPVLRRLRVSLHHHAFSPNPDCSDSCMSFIDTGKISHLVETSIAEIHAQDYEDG